MRIGVKNAPRTLVKISVPRGPEGCSNGGPGVSDAASPCLMTNQ